MGNDGGIDMAVTKPALFSFSGIVRDCDMAALTFVVLSMYRGLWEVDRLSWMVEKGFGGSNSVKGGVGDASALNVM